MYYLVLGFLVNSSGTRSNQLVVTTYYITVDNIKIGQSDRYLELNKLSLCTAVSHEIFANIDHLNLSINQYFIYELISVAWPSGKH